MSGMDIAALALLMLQLGVDRSDMRDVLDEMRRVPEAKTPGQLILNIEAAKDRVDNRRALDGDV